MQLKILFENYDLSTRITFVTPVGPWELYQDNPMKEAHDFYVTDPPPGIDSIPDAKVIDVKPINNGEETLVWVEMSVESFVRNCVQYDIDPYEILKDVKKFAGQDAAKATYEFIKTAQDLTVAKFDIDADTDIEQWPTKPNL